MKVDHPIIYLRQPYARINIHADSHAVSPKITALAKEWFFRFQQGNIDRSQLDRSSNSNLNPSLVRDEAAILKPYGKPTRFVYMGSHQIGQAKGYDFLISFHKGKALESIAFNKSGKIVGLHFQTFPD